MQYAKKGPYIYLLPQHSKVRNIGVCILIPFSILDCDVIITHCGACVTVLCLGRESNPAGSVARGRGEPNRAPSHHDTRAHGHERRREEGGAHL